MIEGICMKAECTGLVGERKNFCVTNEESYMYRRCFAKPRITELKNVWKEQSEMSGVEMNQGRNDTVLAALERRTSLTETFR